MKNNFQGNVTGSVAPLLAIAIVPLLIAGGVAVDFATEYRAKSAIQHAADAAALAGASLTDGNDEERSLAAKKMFAANIPDWVKGDIGAPLIEVDDDERTVSVKVASKLPTAFMRLVGVNDVTVTNIAVAVRDDGRRLCMLALDEDEPNSIVINGTADLVAPNCAVQTNSTKPNAIKSTGSAHGEAEEFCSAGSYNSNGQNLTPRPRGGCARIEDPYADLEAPDIVGCDYNNTSFSSGSYTISPGVYCGGIDLSSHADVSLEPGVYIVKDGPLTLSSHSNLHGDDVIFYLTGTNTYFRINSHADLDLKAPTTGPYANIAITQDPTSNAGAKNFLNGGGQLRIDGVVHVPTQTIEMAGGGGIGAVSHAWSLIASKLYFTGNAQVHISADEDEANLPRILENPRLIQ